MIPENLTIYNNRPLAIDDSGKKLSLKYLDEVSLAFFRFLKDRDLVLLLVENSIEALAGYLAFTRMRVVPLMLSARLDPSSIYRLIDIYKPPYIWMPSSLKPKFLGQELVTFNGYCLFRLEHEGPDLYEDLSLLLSTSGSTGSPKLVRHSYGNLQSSALNVSNAFRLVADDRPVVNLPMHFTMGLSVITSHLAVGSTILLTDYSITNQKFWSFIKEYEATSFTGIPYSYELLLRLKIFDMHLPRLQAFYQGGGKLREDIFRTFVEYAKESGKRFVATYGQTEATARMTFLSSDDALGHIGSIGKSIPDGHLSLLDSEGVILSHPKATGTLVFRGPTVSLGYASIKADLSIGDVFNGRLNTGDIAKRDEEGFYYILGRKSRFVKLYGLRISLDQVEQNVKTKFDIECVASGDDDLLILTIDNLELSSSVKDFAVATMGLHHHSIRVDVVSSFPRNDAGKIIFS